MYVPPARIARMTATPRGCMSCFNVFCVNIQHQEFQQSIPIQSIIQITLQLKFQFQVALLDNGIVKYF